MKGRASRQHVVQRSADSIDVHSPGGRLAAGLLWRHVRWTASELPRHGLVAVRGNLESAGCLGVLGFTEHSREPPVNDGHFAIRPHYDVAGLDVSMHHALGMRIRHGVCRLNQHPDMLSEVIERAGMWRRLLDVRAKGPSLDLSHHIKGPTIGQQAHIVDRHDSGVLKRARDASLPKKAAPRLWTTRPVRRQCLQGDPTMELAVKGIVDRTIGTRAKDLPNLIPITSR